LKIVNITFCFFGRHGKFKYVTTHVTLAVMQQRLEDNANFKWLLKSGTLNHGKHLSAQAINHCADTLFFERVG